VPSALSLLQFTTLVVAQDVKVLGLSSGQKADPQTLSPVRAAVLWGWGRGPCVAWKVNLCTLEELFKGLSLALEHKPWRCRELRMELLVALSVRCDMGGGNSQRLPRTSKHSISGACRDQLQPLTDTTVDFRHENQYFTGRSQHIHLHSCRSNTGWVVSCSCCMASKACVMIVQLLHGRDNQHWTLTPQVKW